jgi:hypothetical protein
MATPLRTPYTLRIKGGAIIHRSECADALTGNRAGLTADEAAKKLRDGARYHGECISADEHAYLVA